MENKIECLIIEILKENNIVGTKGQYIKRIKNVMRESKIKKPRSSYIFYCQENRQKITEENKNATPKEIMSILGAKWKELSELEKEKYIEMWKNDKKRYEKEINEKNSCNMDIDNILDFVENSDN